MSDPIDFAPGITVRRRYTHGGVSAPILVTEVSTDGRFRGRIGDGKPVIAGEGEWQVNVYPDRWELADDPTTIARPANPWPGDGPVYVEVESHFMFCLRHEEVWDTRWSHCRDEEEHERCTPVPLYIEARDP